MSRTGYRKGMDAEKLAALFLRLKGYKIMAQRFKTPLGEIDLVAVRCGVLVFAEVKLRKTGEDAAEAIHAVNQERVRRAAALYLQKHPEYTVFDIRFDAVVMARGGWPRHIVNAF